jgi:hypothetical protein
VVSSWRIQMSVQVSGRREWLEGRPGEVPDAHRLVAAEVGTQGGFFLLISYLWNSHGSCFLGIVGDGWDVGAGKWEEQYKTVMFWGSESKYGVPGRTVKCPYEVSSHEFKHRQTDWGMLSVSWWGHSSV